MLIVEKLPWGNTLDVTRGVEQAMAELAPGLSGIDVDTTIFRPATFVEMSIDNLGRAMLLGFLLVVVIIVLFLFEWRVALISVITIPLSLMAAALVLDWRGTTVNTMVLAGLVIALGVIVDDAIIDVENIVRRLRQHRRERSGNRRPRSSSRRRWRCGGRSSTRLDHRRVCAPGLLPLGLTGAFFKPLALSYTLGDRRFAGRRADGDAGTH